MKKQLATWILQRLGWTLVGAAPSVPKCVFIFAPHTSNWDFIVMYLAKIAKGVNVNFLGKHTLFRWPYGWFFRWLGGIPVVRHEKHNVVDDSIHAFAQNAHLWLAMAPEGTRSKTDYWRSGFYHIAVGAKVPVQLCFLDTTKRELGLGPVIELCGNIEQDFETLRNFYGAKRGIKAELASTIQPRKQP